MDARAPSFACQGLNQKRWNNVQNASARGSVAPLSAMSGKGMKTCTSAADCTPVPRKAATARRIQALVAAAAIVCLSGARGQALGQPAYAQPQAAAASYATLAASGSQRGRPASTSAAGGSSNSSAAPLQAPSNLSTQAAAAPAAMPAVSGQRAASLAESAVFVPGMQPVDTSGKVVRRHKLVN